MTGIFGFVARYVFPVSKYMDQDKNEINLVGSGRGGGHGDVIGICRYKMR